MFKTHLQALRHAGEQQVADADEAPQHHVRLITCRTVGSNANEHYNVCARHLPSVCSGRHENFAEKLEAGKGNNDCDHDKGHVTSAVFRWSVRWLYDGHLDAHICPHSCDAGVQSLSTKHAGFKSVT